MNPKRMMENVDGPTIVGKEVPSEKDIR